MQIDFFATDVSKLQVFRRPWQWAGRPLKAFRKSAINVRRSFRVYVLGLFFFRKAADGIFIPDWLKKRSSDLCLSTTICRQLGTIFSTSTFTSGTLLLVTRLNSLKGAGDDTRLVIHKKGLYCCLLRTNWPWKSFFSLWSIDDRRSFLWLLLWHSKSRNCLSPWGKKSSRLSNGIINVALWGKKSRPIVVF